VSGIRNRGAYLLYRMSINNDTSIGWIILKAYLFAPQLYEMFTAHLLSPFDEDINDHQRNLLNIQYGIRKSEIYVIINEYSPSRCNLVQYIFNHISIRGEFNVIKRTELCRAYGIWDHNEIKQYGASLNSDYRNKLERARYIQKNFPKLHHSLMGNKLAL
jgi:hypothetical protein